MYFFYLCDPFALTLVLYGAPANFYLWGERRQWSHLPFSMENCLELAIRTEGAVGSVAPTIEQGMAFATHLPNATVSCS